MGVEILGSEVPVTNGSRDGKSLGQQVEEPITFSSHGADLPVKVEEEEAKDNNLPKDAVDEWPAPKQIHSFYFVKVRPFDDPKLKVKIEQSDKEMFKKNQTRYQITEALKAKRAERRGVIDLLKPLTDEDKQYRMILDEKRKEIEPLNQALGKLRTSGNSSRDGGPAMCSSEQDLDDRIRAINYQIQHESNTLADEKKLLKEISKLQATREKVIANSAMKAKIQESLGQKESIQEQVKLIGADLDGVRKEKQFVREKISVLEYELKTIESEMNSLQEELIAINEKKEKSYDGLLELRKQRDEVNASFYQNRSLLNNAKELAAKKDITALVELSQTEVEKFMSLWSSSKTFRDDYEKRILTSLDMRQLSRDGRMRNPDEKLLVPFVHAPMQAAATAEPGTFARPSVKRPKEESKPEPVPVLAKKVVKEETDKVARPKALAKGGELEDKENISKSKVSKVDVTDVAKLKELKREEEIAKAKLALERKKKQAEKAAAKAAIRAQKEAEKKIKDQERKAAKKAAKSVSPATAEQTEVDTEVTETETADVSEEAEVVPVKPKDHKETNTTRNRNRARGGQGPPKALLKRRKSTPYWVWAAPAALFVVMLLALGYYYYTL